MKLDLGPCCACRRYAENIRNVVALDLRAPVPGTGWSCLVCHLPADGAVAVVCDACHDAGAPIVDVCLGEPARRERMPIEFVTEPFAHRMALHETPAAWERRQIEARRRRRPELWPRRRRLHAFDTPAAPGRDCLCSWCLSPIYGQVTHGLVVDPAGHEFRLHRACAHEVGSLGLRFCQWCGCTDVECRPCIERTGRPCSWVGETTCSACAALHEEHGPRLLALSQIALSCGLIAGYADGWSTWRLVDRRTGRPHRYELETAAAVLGRLVRAPASGRPLGKKRRFFAHT